MRRARKIVLGLLVTGALALATLPFWTPLVLRPIARGQGVTFSNYERVGYGRFRLHDVKRDDVTAKFSARQVEVDTPLRWGWRALWGSDRGVFVEDWTLELTGAPNPKPSTKPPPTGVIELHAQLRETVGVLSRWLPQATLRRGEVRAPKAGIDSLRIAEFDWNRGVATARGVEFRGRTLTFETDLAKSDALQVRAQSPADHADAALTWSGAELTGRGSWSGQPWQLNAKFAANSWTPTDAEFVAENWTLPATYARLENEYAQLTGGGRLRWREQKLEFTTEFHAAPKEGAKAPPLHARASAHGDRQAVVVDAFEIQAPFATATLSAPVTIPLTGAVEAPPAQLSLRIDLAKQPWFEAAGTITGSVQVSGSTTASRQSFRLSGDEVKLAGVALHRLNLAGELAWPQFTLSELSAQLDEQSRFTAKGGADLQQRELRDVTVNGQLAAAWFARWLPKGVEWKSLELDAKASGPFAAPAHEGSAKLTTLHSPPLRPLDASLEWRGHGAALETIAGRATAAESTLQFAGTTTATELQLRELRLHRAGLGTLNLAQPAVITWKQPWRVTGLRLDATDGHLALSATGGDALQFEAEIVKLSDAWLRDWLPITGPEWTANSLRASGRAENGVVVFETNLDATAALENNPTQLVLLARGNDNGIELKQLEVRSPSGVLGHGTGLIPLVLEAPRGASGAPAARWIPDGKLRFEGETQPESPLWAAVAQPAGLELAAPRARIRIAGTPEQPTGELDLEITRLAPAEKSRWQTLPAIDRLALKLRAERGAIAIESFSAALEGQEIRGTARVPVGENGWAQLTREPRKFDWNEAEARIEIPGADLRPLAEGRATFPLAQGKLIANVTLARGRKFSGSLQLSDAMSRPVPTLGVFQNLRADLVLEGRRLEVRQFAAQLGGEDITLTGRADLSEPAAPQLDLTLQGKRLPLVRRDGMLIRADVDLTAKSVSTSAPPHIGGTLTLRDSLILADLRQFIPTGVRAAERAPPYFSISAEPFRQWPLGVDVRGERGVRLQTPVVAGFATPHFRLEGTLGEPRLIGEATLDAAKLLFPFATFEVQHGVVRLTQADPFHPQLTLNAQARRYGYDLKLEGRGPVDQPVITLSSNPALPTEQVLLMVMAGQAPTDDTSPSGSSQGKRLTVLGTYLGRGLFRELGSDDSEKITLTSGEQISEQGGETYAVEYKLSPRWSLVGEYDEFDDYNAGVKWRAFTEDASDAKAKQTHPPKP